MAKEENEWQEVVSYAKPELDPHGADYGFRRLIISLPDNAKGAYIVRYKKASRADILKSMEDIKEDVKQWKKK